MLGKDFSANRAFTIVELLAVIAIVAILAALLMPVLAQAHEKALQSVSASNLRQLATATIMYAGDHDDYYPCDRNNEAFLLNFDPSVTTFGYPTDSKEPSLLVDSLSPYTRSSSIWFCPTDPFAHRWNAEGLVNHQFSSYLYWATPDDLDPLFDTPFPLVTNGTELASEATLFSEVHWFDLKATRTYWNSQITQSAAVDGHVEIFHQQ